MLGVPYSKLFIWVEGRDDRRFFENRIKPPLKDKYDQILVREYQHRTKDQIKGLIRPKNEWGLHLFFADIDRQPCVTSKKDQIVQKKFGQANPENIYVVVQEIESWYLAGLDSKSCGNLGLPENQNTDAVTKEVFNRLMANSGFDSRVNFMQEILRLFSIDVAKAKNTSFRYFASRHLPEAADSENK